MKKNYFYVAALVSSLILTACGPSAEDKAKIENDALELERLMNESMNELDKDLDEKDTLKSEVKTTVTKTVTTTKPAQTTTKEAHSKVANDIIKAAEDTKAVKDAIRKTVEEPKSEKK